MIPSILQGLSQKPGSTLDKAIGNEAEALDMKGFNAYANSMNPVATPARRQPAFRTQDLILGLLPALLGGGQQYVADYLKGKFGAADQLTQEDQAKAQEEQKRRMMMGQLENSFYGQKADRLRQGQDTTMKRGWQLEDQAARVAQDKLNDEQARARQEDSQSFQMGQSERTAKQNYFRSLDERVNKGIPVSEADILSHYTMSGWKVTPEDEAAARNIVASQTEAGRFKRYQDRMKEASKISDYSKVNHAPTLEAIAKESLDYFKRTGSPEYQHYFEVYSQRAKDAKKAYEKSMAKFDVMLDNEKKKGILSGVQADWKRKVIAEMPDRLRAYTYNMMKAPKGASPQQMAKDLINAASKGAIRQEQIWKSIESRNKWSSSEELMKSNPAYAAAKTEWQKNVDIMTEAIRVMTGEEAMDVPETVDIPYGIGQGVTVPVPDTAKAPAKKSQATAHAEAKKAISAGASKDAVNARLKKLGYAPLP